MEFDASCETCQLARNNGLGLWYTTLLHDIFYRTAGPLAERTAREFARAQGIHQAKKG